MSVREPISQPGNRASVEKATLADGNSSDRTTRLARLARTIEAEIVPRLVVCRRIKAQPQGGGEFRQNVLPEDLDVKELVRLLLAHEPGIASAYVDVVRQRGATLESICLDLLAPAARELGLLWEEDECDFMQVTVGLCRLHQVLRGLSPAFACPEWEDDSRARRVLLVAFPGEQHTFGITLVAQFLRRAGWDVSLEYPTSTAELLELARGTYFAVLGISVGCETRLESVAETISAVRQCSRNADIGILVGGPVLAANPALVASLGADGTACDGREAVQWAEQVRNDGRRRELSQRR